MNDNVKMLLESVEFKNWADFVNTTGVGRIIAAMIIEERNKVSMFTQIPGLVQQGFNIEAGAGDQIEVYKMTAAKGVGIPGEYQSNRQLSGNEAQFDFNFSKELITVGLHRYAVALRNFTDKHFLPQQMVNYALSSISSWWVEQSDSDVFTTLFRDYPAYYAERNTIVSTQSERLLALFGRGPRNDIGVSVTVYMPNGKTDIEGNPTVALTDEDTLSDVFLRKLNSFCQNLLGMPPISMEDSLNVYGLIVDQTDISFLRANSSDALENKITSAFQGQGWNSPIFKNVIGDLEGIRLFKWDPVANNDNKNALQPANSPYKGLNGTSIFPMGRILAAAVGGQSVSGLSVWAAGDLAGERGVEDEDADLHFLLVSNGAKNFPYFEGGAVVGKDSLNKAQVSADMAAFDSCDLKAGEYVGRLQIGQGLTSLTRFKVYYTGPTYVGSLRVGSPMAGNNSFVEDVYKLKIHAIATWNATTEQFNDPVDPSEEYSSGAGSYWDILRAFLAIDRTTNVVSREAQYNNYTFLMNQRIHMFDVVRSICFGANILYEAYAGKEVNLAAETRDYGSVMGNGLTAVTGKKIATNSQGLVNGYIIVPFKRPQHLL